ncbi:MAG: type II toxin-antitoxin system YafQ family toxin [Candidatus Riflebacteria bacterium]|nr:type II toxin-antitoxin system YafQ family toxin [Candidatus Riflebacteria bacterium]
MLEARETTTLRRDLRRVIAQGKDFELFRAVLSCLVNEEPLDPKYRDHALSHNWKGYRELHIQPDWLLIYKITGNILILARTGSHSELFG